MKKFVGILITGFLLSGCMDPSMPRVKGLTYLASPPLEVPVKAIEVHGLSPGEFHSDPSLPSFSLMLQQWAKESLIASGGTHKLLITFVQASCKDIELAPDPTSSLFKLQNSDKKVGFLRVRFDLVDSLGMKTKTAFVSVRSEQYAVENYRIVERKAMTILLYEDIINRLTRETQSVLLRMINPSMENCDDGS